MLESGQAESTHQLDSAEVHKAGIAALHRLQETETSLSAKNPNPEFVGTMQYISFDTLKQLIFEALELNTAEQRRFEQQNPSVPVSIGRGYPHPFSSVDLISKKASLSNEQAKRQLMYRLKRFRYPYPEGNKSHKTFYRHVKEEGVLDVLFTRDLFFQISFEWFDRRYYTRNYGPILQRVGKFCSAPMWATSSSSILDTQFCQ
jgi:hypothetical protein